MKKKLLLICLLFTLSTAAYSQIGTLNIRLNRGYNSGPNWDIGIGAGMYNIDDFPSVIGGEFIIGRESHKIEDIKFSGAKINCNLILSYIKGGISISLLQNEEKSRTVVKPEIGATLFGIASITYTYTISDTKDFFPDSYSKSGINFTLIVPIPLYFPSFY